MLCSRCQKQTAHFHFKSVVNDKVTQLDLCQDCADASGLASPLMLPALPVGLNHLFNVLSQMSIGGGLERPRIPKPAACPRCAWTMAHFQKTGKLGCAECYQTFSTELKEILKKIQGQSTHKGKEIGRAAPKKKAETTVEPRDQLTLRLEKALREENYELAAQLRDKMRDLEKKK